MNRPTIQNSLSRFAVFKSNAGRIALATGLAIGLAACGGGGGSTATTPGGGGGTGGGTGGGGTGTNACSIQNQIEFADNVLNEWYLFPNLLDNTVNPASFTDVQSFLNARVRPAFEQGRDQGFTFATSIAEENALISSGSSAGFGVRLAFRGSNQLFILESYESGNGFGAGLDRGAEILAIGPNENELTTVQALLNQGGGQAVSDALGPSDPGVSRSFRFRTPDGQISTISVAKSEFSLNPISERYGVSILDNGGTKVGYLNFRTFIVGTSDRQLVDAFQFFADEGVTEFIFDLRYNGGGLVRIGELMGDLLRGTNTGSVFSRTVLRESKSSENTTRFFRNTAGFFNPASNTLSPQEPIPSVTPLKVAVITTNATASASELVTNSLIPYVPASGLAIVGSNTSGKPVGQFAFDLADCDLRVRAVTFQTVNADGNGDYFNGLAGTVPNSCSATDELALQLGDPQENSLATALSFLRGEQCNAIPLTAGTQGVRSVNLRGPLMPARPTAAQFEMPGLF